MSFFVEPKTFNVKIIISVQLKGSVDLKFTRYPFRFKGAIFFRNLKRLERLQISAIARFMPSYFYFKALWAYFKPK